MTEKRFYCDDSLEYRSYGIFDLSKADKKMDDFRDEDGDICSWMFHNYIVEETDSMLSGEQVEDRLNKQDTEIKKLQKENQKLQQFHDKVLTLIDKKIEEEFHNRIKHDNVEHLMEYYKGRHTMLGDLKKELCE